MKTTKRMTCLYRLYLWRNGIAVIFAAVLAASMAPGAAVAGGCGTIVQIGAAGTCGIVINKSGCYQLTADQTAHSATADCITIEESDVFLTLTDRTGTGHVLIGTGASDTAAGIHVLAKNPVTMSPVANVAIGGGGFFVRSGKLVVAVQNFNIGVLIEGSKVFSSLLVMNNNVDGIHLSAASNCAVTGGSDFNGVNGVALFSSSGNVIAAGATFNKNDGVALVSSNSNIVTGQSNSNENGVLLHGSNSNTVSFVTAGPDCIGCGHNNNVGIVLQSSSNNNLLSSNVVFNNPLYGIWLDGSSNNELASNAVGGGAQTGSIVGTYLGCSAPGPNPGETCSTNSDGNHLDNNFLEGSDNYGLVVDRGSSTNVTVDTVVGGLAASTDDLLDNNTNCDSNTWFANGFIKASPASCVH